MYPSTTKELLRTPYRSSLARKYAIKHFLALTNRSKDALLLLAQFLITTGAIAYFSAHLMLYITGYYDRPTAVTHPQHLVKIK